MSDGQRGVALLVSVAGLAAATPALAQQAVQDEGGPLVVGRRQEWRQFELARVDAAVSTEARWRRSEQDVEGGDDISETERYLLGQLELGGEAYIGHRNLLDVVAQVALGYEQTDRDSDVEGVSGTDDDFRTLYDISGLILQEGPAPLTVYSRREEVRLERQFVGTIDSTNTEHGAMLRIRSDWAPTWLHYFHRETDQTDPFNENDFFQTQDTFAMRSDVVLTDQQDLSFEYTFDSVDERLSSAFENSYQRHDARLTHSWDFGPEELRHNLRSMLRYYDESGLADLQRIRLDETLRLQHTRDFDTRYDLVVEQVDRLGQTQNFYSGQAQARYRLFESVVTTASGGLSRLEIEDDFTSDQIFGDAIIEYTKRVPYGRLDASVGAGYNVQNDGERGEPLAIFDDQLVLNDTIPSIISRRNILGDSVIVTNSTGTRVFIEGIDYTLQVFPDRVEVRRIIGGAISDGEVVLVDYVIGPEPEATIDTLTANFAARYTIEESFLRGLGVFVVYQWVDQSVDTADPMSFIVEDLRDLRYGADYRIGGLTLLAEQQHRDSSTFPYDTTRLEARYALRISPTSALAASASHTTTDYRDDGDEVDINRANLRYYGRLWDDLSFDASLIYRDESARIAGDSTGFDQLLQLTWRKGKTTVNASVRNSMLETEITDTVTQEVSVGLRRTF